MNVQKNCKFCIRYGLPVLPVRPSVVAMDDTLPHLPEGINVPVKSQGETAWTGRLLREGFLYIWSESGKRWINYFATREGYYYPLPENGEVLPDIINGKVKPCIDQPEELAVASLITLPVKPSGTKNGVFWFCWSEVAWTSAVRKKHEDAVYRGQYMQRFDMDAWVTGGKEEQAIALTALGETVAEYSYSAGRCKARKWSAAPWKTVNPVDGLTLISAANKLYPDKGVMILLQDPPAVLQDLSTIIDYELQEKIYKNKEYEREFALSTAITALKEAMILQFERDHIEKCDAEERRAIFGPSGYSGGMDISDNMYSSIGDRQLKPVVAKKWAEYEQYYDPEKVADFQAKFREILTRYNETVVGPRTDMYLKWIKSNTLVGYFQHNFDTEDLSSGIEYIQTLNYCIVGMQDKIEVFRHFGDLLAGTPTDTTNILARALVFNQNELAKKLVEATAGKTKWMEIPWNWVAEAYKTYIEKMRENAAGVAGILISATFGILAGKVIQAVESKTVYSTLVAIGAITNKALLPLEKTGTYKQFAEEVLERMAKDSGLDSRVNKDSLRHYIRRELRRLKINNLPMDKKEVKSFLVMVEIDKIPELKALPLKERKIALSKLLRTHADVDAQQFTRWKGAVNRGIGRTGNAMPVTAGVFSAVLQVASLYITADIKDKKTLTADQQEAHARFYAGASSIGSTTLNAIETALKQFGSLSRSRLLSSEVLLKWTGYIGKFFGVVASAVLAGYDFYHAWDELNKGHAGLFVAYGVSGIAGVWMGLALIWAIPVLGTIIAMGVLIGAAIYIGSNSRDKIQKWLLRCFWRRIPVDTKNSKKTQDEYKETEAVGNIIYPNSTTEMNEFKLAIG